MKTNPTETKLTAASGSLLVVKLLFLLLVLPVSIPAAALFVQALVWRYILCRIDGINLTGGLLEAFALSLALGVFAVLVSLLVRVAVDSVRKVKKLPLQKISTRKLPEITTWSDLYKAVPGFSSLLQQFTVTAFALASFTALQPLRLQFHGPFEFLLAAGVLTATWLFCTTSACLIACAFMIKDLKAKAASGKAAV
jgi:hypothetical protein